MYVLWTTGFRVETVCCLWPVDAPRLRFWSHLSNFLWSAFGGSSVTLSHPSRVYILDTSSSSIMQWHSEISCLSACRQDNMVTPHVQMFYGSMDRGSEFVAKLFRGQFSQLTCLECVSVRLKLDAACRDRNFKSLIQFVQFRSKICKKARLTDCLFLLCIYHAAMRAVSIF